MNRRLALSPSFSLAIASALLCCNLASAQTTPTPAAKPAEEKNPFAPEAELQ